MGKSKKKATKRHPPRRPGPLTAEDIAAIERGDVKTTVEMVGPTRVPYVPAFRSMTIGQIMKWVRRVQRGEPIAYLAFDSVHKDIVYEPLPPPRKLAPRPAPKPRGAPLKHPALLALLRTDVRDHESHTPRQRAARLKLPLSTVRRYLERLALEPR